jgi:hypothetical protein
MTYADLRSEDRASVNSQQVLGIVSGRSLPEQCVASSNTGIVAIKHQPRHNCSATCAKFTAMNWQGHSKDQSKAVREMGVGEKIARVDTVLYSKTGRVLRTSGVRRELGESGSLRRAVVRDADRTVVDGGGSKLM